MSLAVASTAVAARVSAKQSIRGKAVSAKAAPLRRSARAMAAHAGGEFSQTSFRFLLPWIK
jgi:hypothetical protein